MIGFEQIGPVIVVLGLLVGSLWFLRRRGLAQFTLPGKVRTAAERQMEVLERVPLTAQHSLHRVRVADRTIVVAVSPSGCSLMLDESAKDAR